MYSSVSFADDNNENPNPEVTSLSKVVCLRVEIFIDPVERINCKIGGIVNGSANGHIMTG